MFHIYLPNYIGSILLDKGLIGPGDRSDSVGEECVDLDFLAVRDDQCPSAVLVCILITPSSRGPHSSLVIRVGVSVLRLKGMPLLGLEKKSQDLPCGHGFPAFRLLRTRLSSTFGVATVAVWTTHKQTCGDLELNFRSGGIWN